MIIPKIFAVERFMITKYYFVKTWMKHTQKNRNCTGFFFSVKASLILSGIKRMSMKDERPLSGQLNANLSLDLNLDLL
jgi:hypothetical protein